MNAKLISFTSFFFSNKYGNNSYVKRGANLSAPRVEFPEFFRELRNVSYHC